MLKKSPIKAVEGIQLVPSSLAGIAQVVVTEKTGLKRLSWDRYVRLQATAENVLPGSLLDVGGYDGALALFLEGCDVHLLDAETTGGNALKIAAGNQNYDCVTLVDVLEHIDPDERLAALKECARITSKQLILNYPCQESLDAQNFMLKLTNNALVKEHVQWPLPDTNWVVQCLNELGFSAQVKEHTSIAIWMGQYLVQNLLPEDAAELNALLIKHHAKEPFDKPLYHLITAVRN